MSKAALINSIIEHVLQVELPMRQISDKRFEILNDNLKGEVRFYDFSEPNILELSIYDEDKKETTFYLHFELYEEKEGEAKYFIRSFFKALQKEADLDPLVAYSCEHTKKILLCCTGGLSSYLFASMMQEYLESIHSNMHVDAVGIAKVDDIASQYDLILMAPSVSYRYEEYKQKYGDKLHRLDPLHFATLDVRSVVEKIH
jgi:cellobiose-specific phosphotransferase system component IIB